MNDEKIKEILLIVDLLENAIKKNDHMEVGRQLFHLRDKLKSLLKSH
jgi:hypothetical protein